MRTGILINVRLGSSRLKKKHLLTVKNHPIIYYLIKRIKNQFSKELEESKIKLIIAASNENENRELEVLRDEIEIFYGSKNNIPLRHLQIADFFDIDYIIALDGDNIVCSTYGMKLVYERLLAGDKYVKTCNLPLGMNSTGYNKKFLEESVIKHIDEILDTGWTRLFDTNDLTNIHTQLFVDGNNCRLTLDYMQDYHFFKILIEELNERIYNASDEEIVKIVLDKKLYKINGSLSKEYWERFYKKMEEDRNAEK